MTACTACARSAPRQSKDETVILLHGMGRTRRAMSEMARYLRSNGYRVVNPGYPSTREAIDAIAANHLAPVVERCRNEQPGTPLHFVTHSLGGIVVRQYLQKHTLPPGSRVVMLSPPSRGSELADCLRDFWLYRWRNGPAGQQLGTGPHSVPNTLKPVKAEIGVITGNRSFNPLFSQLIPGPDDGKVSVARARLAEMTDFTVIPATHTFIMRHPTALKQILYFLEHGKFRREAGF
ncbi:acetyltransferase [Desulfonema ishimotonii]|uniref:Acetyltransferase n=1 Tax=Desulfonema ishimotonii TaxID=45657 RepID=A0A401FU34_9BACT|nr:acetyltransferase [Desulfonema ishimotonii]